MLTSGLTLKWLRQLKSEADSCFIKKAGNCENNYTVLLYILVQPCCANSRVSLSVSEKHFQRSVCDNEKCKRRNVMMNEVISETPRIHNAVQETLRERDTESKFTALICWSSNSAPLFIKLSTQQLLTKTCQVSSLFNFTLNALQHGSLSVRTWADTRCTEPSLPLTSAFCGIYIRALVCVMPWHANAPPSSPREIAVLTFSAKKSRSGRENCTQHACTDTFHHRRCELS